MRGGDRGPMGPRSAAHAWGTSLCRLKMRGVGCICSINQGAQVLLASPLGRDEALWCAGLMAGKTREVPDRAQPGPESSALARRAASDLPPGGRPFTLPRRETSGYLAP